jgi:hypothetical protein
MMIDIMRQEKRPLAVVKLNAWVPFALRQISYERF